jgi:hypothetical protein
MLMRRTSFKRCGILFALGAVLVPARLMATANYVYHEQTANNPTAGSSSTTCPAGIQYVDNLSPLPTQAYTLHFKVEYQFYTDQVRVYYTTNGSNPTGSYGAPGANTSVVTATYQCTFNAFGNNVDVCAAAIPPLPAGTLVKYIVSAWHSPTGSGGPEIFANSGTCSGCNPCSSSTCATVFQYRVFSPIVLNCSSNITVTATGPSGAIVTYTSSATGGCTTPTVNCTPPSGSVFPVGTNTVICTASDTCNTTTNCSFTITVKPRPVPEYFATAPILPPPSTMYVSPALWHQLYANGIIIRDIRHRFFTGGLEAPPLGGSQLHTFGSEIDLEVSRDNGNTYQPATGNATVTVRVTHTQDVSGVSQYSTTMEQLDLTFPTTQGPIMIHQSPTLPSSGQTTIRPAPGGFMISSFFDIFTELSLDGGNTWSPAQQSGHMEMRPEPLQIAPVGEPTPLLPPPNDMYISPATYHALYAQGIVIKDVRHKLFTTPVLPPPLGLGNTERFNSILELQVSLDGGKTFQYMQTTAPVQVTVSHSSSATDNDLYDTAMTMLNVTLPGGGMLRASSNYVSRGITQVDPKADGTFQIHSFFDIFTELSLDGGNTWQTASNGPVHMGLTSQAPESGPTTFSNLPPANGQYVSPAAWHAAYANGIIISNVSHSQFIVPTPVPLPAPGTSQQENFNSMISGQISLDGGKTYQPFSGPASTTVNVTSRSNLDNGSTRFFDTQMLGLNLQGLPAGAMVRQSPTKLSLGRTSVRQDTGGMFHISSFFDVFTELSLDGGNNWAPLTNHPGTVALTPGPQPIEVDYFPNTIAQITVSDPSGQTTDALLSGPCTVNVMIGPNGAATDSNGDGLDDVATEMVQLALSGMTPLGPIAVNLDTTQHSLGEIEETVNNTPGTLDLPPFTATGSANSFFDIFVTVTIAGQTMHPATPLHMQSLITHKPPAPGETYANPYTNPIPLLDGSGAPTGFKVVREIHTPTPTNPPPMEVDKFPNTTAQITLKYANNQTEVVTLTGPTTVNVQISPDGRATPNSNGLDTVSTEMTAMNLSGSSSMGPITATLDPGHRSLGQIIETVNNTPGILDLPPFRATGTASSFFDVFVDISIGGQTLHPATPLHMTSVIHHKPPAPGDQYTNTFLTPVSLLDANGNPTGITVVREVHTPNPTNPPVEVDYFPNTTAQITLQYPGGGSEVVALNGPTTVNVNIPPNGAASDTDGSGLDEVSTEMTQLELSGVSSMGLVKVSLNPNLRSLGEIQETANNTPGILDIPPFTAGGTANSFFDIFVDVQIGAQTFHPAGPLHMNGLITHKPPGPGDTYTNTFLTPVPLLDANGNPTGFQILREVHTPNPTNPPPVEIDKFPNTSAQLTLQYANNQIEVVELSGPSTVRVNIPPNGHTTLTSNGLDYVTTEMTALTLSGASSMGPVVATLDPGQRSLGQIQETANNTPGTLDIPPFTATGTATSFFDVFVDITVGGQTLHPQTPLHMTGLITHKPPAPGDIYTNVFAQPVPLLDATGKPTGILVLREVHSPNPTNPPVEVDKFPNTTAQITLFYTATSQSEVISLNGPTTVIVNIPPNGAASDTDGNGLDQVDTEMTDMDLSGISSLGPVVVKLDPNHRTLGGIEETVNTTPGVLDLPPFTATGTANSFFDVFAQISIGGQTLYPSQPLHITSLIHHKPPAPGDSYFNTFSVPLLDATGNFSGIYITQEIHTPNPTNPPPVEIDRFTNTTAQITLHYPNNSTEVVSLSGPTTVRVNIPPNGQTSTSSNGLDYVSTEMVELNLSGASSMGPVTATLDPTRRSLGQIQENANNTPGTLDVPPFTVTGTAISFFDVFVDLQVNGQTLHTANPLHMSSLIHHKPPAPGDTYTNTFLTPVPLLDTNGNPTGITVVREVHTPNPTNPPPVEVDYFPNTTAQITLQYANNETEVVTLNGPTTVNVNIPHNGAAADLDGDGLDEVTTEMVQLDLSGVSSVGLVKASLDPTQRSLGMIRENANNTPGILDVPPFTGTGTATSFFDVFVDLQVGGQVLRPAGPLHMSGVITFKPPAPGNTYTNTFLTPVNLLDANGNPTGIKILREVHTPNPTNPPPVEIDEFPNTTAQITLLNNLGQTEVIALSGPTTVRVNIPPNGAATDADGNGLDEVTTEMTALNLTGSSSMGPVFATLDPTQRSLGQIEETVNNTPGILDVPPFTATGTANSFFDVFVDIQVGGQTFHPATPLHMTSLIHRKPPAPGDAYVNPFTQPIPLLDAFGNPTGFQVLREVHTPNPLTNTPPFEVDYFSNTVAQVTLQYESGQTEVVTLSGPTTVNVNIPPDGSASDTDGNGLDQVDTEMVQLDLSGVSSRGPVTLNLDPTQQSLGEIEETVNRTPGVLDVPPFTATGSANSFFDVFVVLHVGGQTLHPATPLHMASVITHKPPAPGDTYVNPFTIPVPLLDAAGNPTGIKILREVHTPNPIKPVEIDHFPNTTASITLQKPGGQTEVISLSGPTTVQVNIPPDGTASDSNGNGLDDVPTVMTELNLSGQSSLGPVTVNLDPSRPSLGMIEETVNNTPGVLDVPPFTPTGTASSFFDVFVQVHVAGQTLHSATPMHMTSTIRHKPPQKGDTYVNPFTTPIVLLDANGNPTGYQLRAEVHTPNPTNPPPVEIDHFPNTTASITLQYSSGQTEVVSLSGPTTVQVNIPPNGAASDLDGSGLDEVTTEMTAMNLTGNSSLGPVSITLDPSQPSLGMIQETANNTPGILDVPPFTGTGSATSFFDVFAVVHIGGQTLKPSGPLHMTSLIHHKPPAKGDTYNNPFTRPILLLDANGNPTGIQMVREVHTPNPTNPPPVEIDHFPTTTAQLTLQYPGGGTEVVSLSGPSTVQVNIPPNGAATDFDGSGLDEVTTEMTQLSLTGPSSMGPVTVTLDPSKPSLGVIQETANNTPGILDVPPFTATGTASSFFDIFAVIKVGAQTLYPSGPLHMTSVIRHKPPLKGDTYINPFTQPVLLLDANGNPTGFKVLKEVHTPNPTNPPVEIDHFQNTTAQLTLQKPGGGTEVVTLSGPTTVHVNIPPNGAALDTDGNGLDQVATEMTDMHLTGNSSVGPVTVTLDPNQPSYGQIEENANNTPGILDLPPFTATGTATSFFDVFAEVQIGGQTLHPATALHLTSVITHKPPAKGNTYTNTFTQPVPLLDANGNVTGYQVLREVHTPNPTNPPPVEIDHFPNTSAQITLQLPGGGSESVSLQGPTTVKVNIPPNGAAMDTDGNGLDQVQTEMTQLSLAGNSSLGAVLVTLDPSQPSYGQIEENVNSTPGILDIPPFTATGTASSFFDVFLQVKVAAKTYFPAGPLHMTSTIRHKPPAKGDTYINPFTQPVQLYDASGNPTGIYVIQEVHTPNPTNPPPVEIDHFPNTTATIMLQTPTGSEQVSLSGPTTIQVNTTPTGAALDLDGNGLDQVQTEMTQMSLVGNSSVGPVTVTLDPSQPSLGQIEETANNTPGILDVPPFTATGTATSFFDVFAEVKVGGQTLFPSGPLHMTSTIRHKPPAQGDNYNNPFLQPILLLDANGNPTGYQMQQEVHTPYPTNPPPVEIDYFSNTTATITLQLPSGGSEVVELSGPTTVQVNIPPNGAALDTDGNGLDQVQTEMTQMNLTGNSSMGPVSVTLDPMNPSYGQIEETANNHPGILDLPPFEPSGTANSFFDIFVQIQVGPQTLYPASSLHMASIITHKPPAPGDTYNNPFTQPVPLLDANGNPTGFEVLREVHTPNPTNTPPILLQCSSNITVQATSPSGAVVFYTSTASGGCSPPSVNCNPPSGSTFPLGTTTVTCTAGDNCGGFTNCSFTITVTNAPILLTCSSNITVSTFSNSAEVFYTSSASGGCSPPPFLTCNPASGSTFPVGTTTVTCTANDACGQLTNCSFTITVLHSNVPIVLNCSSNITVTATSSSGATVFYTSTANGGCSPPPSVTCNPPSGSTFPIGTTSVTCTASDTCGQSTNCSFTVTVTRPPIALTCSTNITVTTSSNSAVVFYTSTASGGCSPPSVNCTPASGSTFPLGTSSVTCTASDSCGTTTNCSFTVTVLHSNLPPIVLTCSTNITVRATSSSGATVFYTSTASGGCNPPISPNCNPPSGSTFPIGTTSVTCTASDTCGQSTNCSFIVTVTRPPIALTCSTNITVTTSSNSAVVFYTSTASGGCSPPSVNCTPASGSSFPLGTSSVTCTASDTCGTTTNCSFTVTVIHSNPPPIVLTCSTNITVTTASCTNNTATVFYTSTASGGCSPVNVSCTPPSGSSFPIGTTSVTCTATDGCGNSTNCSFVITVRPYTCPALVLTCSTNITVTTASCTNNTAIVFYTSTASGGCSPVNVSCNPPSGSSFPIGTTSVTCTATDGCGNSTNCSFVITVRPYTCPALVLTCSTNITVTTTNAAGTTVFYTSTAAGGCPPVTVNCTPPSGSTFPIGNTSVTCTATDGCGNRTNCSFLVTVVRTNSPLQVICSTNVVVTTTNGAPVQVVYSSSATGGCPPVSVNCTPPSGSFFRPGATVVTCTATDGCGNSNICSFIVSVISKPRYFGSTNLPPIDGQYVSPAQWHAAYAGGIYISNVVHRGFTQNFPPPTTGTATHTFTSEVDLSLSTDGGHTYNSVKANATCTVSITVGGASGGGQFYNNQMTQLDLGGGTLPPGMRLRVSASPPTTGQTMIAPSGGGFMISSFFDVFTDLSTDGGNTWSPSSSPGHMDLHIDPAVPGTTIAQPHLQAGTFKLTVPSRIGLRYILEFKTNLTDPAWMPLSTTPGNGQPLTITDPATAGAPHRFYHLRIEEDPNQ